MKRNIISILTLLSIMVLSLGTVGCSDKEETIANELNSRCLKRTLGPNVVGNQIYFAYAMAMPYGSGQIESCSVAAHVSVVNVTVVLFPLFTRGEPTSTGTSIPDELV